jgi:hypothetical protein
MAQAHTPAGREAEPATDVGAAELARDILVWLDGQGV